MRLLLTLISPDWLGFPIILVSLTRAFPHCISTSKPSRAFKPFTFPICHASGKESNKLNDA